MSVSYEVVRSPARSEKLFLVAVAGGDMKSIALAERCAAVVGRARDCDLQLVQPSLSRRHARFALQDGELSVEDLGSRNGTQVRGLPLAAGEVRVLRPGDVVECGEVMFVVRAKAAPTLVAAPSERVTRVLVARDASWFEIDGDHRVHLGRRGSLRRVLERLVMVRLEAPGCALSVNGIFAAGWPGEPNEPQSVATRVFIAVQRLRGLGFGQAVVSCDDGYLFDPKVGFDRV